MIPERHRLFVQLQLIVITLVVAFLLIFTACSASKEDKGKLNDEPVIIRIAYIKMPDDSVKIVEIKRWQGFDPYAIITSIDGTKYRVSYENFVIVEETP